MSDNFEIKPARAPMRNDSYKRFAMYKKAQKRSWLDFLFDWIVKGIIIALLISINFILFASSANYSLFAEGIYVIPNIVLPVIVIFALSLGAMFFISFSKILENLMLATVVGCFVFAMINQFLMVSPDSFLYSLFYGISPSLAKNFLTGSDFIVAVTAGVISFILVSILSNRIIAIIGLIILIILGAVIADEYINQRHKSEFVTLFDNKKPTTEVKGNKFIYIMLPSATSYRYLSDIEEEQIAAQDINKTKELMLGFYAKNNFTMYANAYLEDDDQFMNIVNQFNILSNKKGQDSVLNQIVIDGYLKFKNHNEKSVYLEDNKLFDKFKNANYKINVYQSHGIELCQRNNENVADKCVEKQNNPFNFDNMNISEFQKTQFLLLQWFNSTTLFKDLSGLYSLVNIFTDANKVALVGVPYDNLYVINSIKTLDVMFTDIASETNNTTYFALLDIPSEMYVYDEFCNIKPSSEWLAKENLPWVKVPNIADRKRAYMNQTNCLYGKLQEFMDKLKEYNLDENSVVIVQGISGLNDKKGDVEFVNSFRSRRSVTMAIREPKNKAFAVDYGICPVSSFLIKYLYGRNFCRQMDDFDLILSSKAEVYRNMKSKKVTRDDVRNARRAFADWYKGWAQNAGIELKEEPVTPIIKQQKTQQVKLPETVDKSVAKIKTEVKKEVVKPIEKVQEIKTEVVTTKVETTNIEEPIVNIEDENFFIEDTIPQVQENIPAVNTAKPEDTNEVLSIELEGLL